jgi:hypothetical protein
MYLEKSKRQVIWDGESNKQENGYMMNPNNLATNHNLCSTTKLQYVSLRWTIRLGMPQIAAQVIPVQWESEACRYRYELYLQLYYQ